MADQGEFKSLQDAIINARKAMKKLRREMRKVHPCIPKTPKRNAYILFCMEMRPYIVQENPDMSPQEVVSTLGRIWREDTGPEERLVYKRLSEMNGTHQVEEKSEPIEKEVKEPELYVHSPFVHYCTTNSTIPWCDMTNEQRLPFMMAHWEEKERRVERGLDPNDPKFQIA